MDRLNSEGIRREHLLRALEDRRTVATARRIDRCLLCRRSSINEAALCEICWSLLSDEEMKVANKWLTGEKP